MSTWDQRLAMLAIGALAGICSGLFGIGGGVILVPALVWIMGYPQVAATGTSLVALLLPVGFLGVLEYYRAGKIDSQNIRMGLIIAIGLFVGAYFGAKLAVGLPAPVLRKAFSLFLVLVAIRLWLI